MFGSMRINRRQALALAASAGMALTLPRGAWAAGTVELGDARITILSDGNLSLPLSFVFPDAPQDELAAMLKEAGLATDMLLPDCNVTLLQAGERNVLFDVGSGANFMPSAGKLLASMEEAGIDPASITDVVFTHAHPDHLWGLLDEFDELVFPDANYHISQAEWDFWRAPETLERMPEERKTFVVGAQSRLAVLEERISLFSPGAEIVSGVEAVDTSGHTPGHVSFALHSGSQSAMVIGDAVSSHPVSLKRPDWPSGSDQDTQKGIEARTKLLDRLANDKMLAIAFHFPHPGAGVIERDGSGYSFTAV